MIENMTNEQAAECLKTIHVLSFKDETATFFLTDVQNAFKLAIKALEQTRPKGKWIIRPDRASDIEYRCSECGKIQFADDTNELNYCCNCGSKMEMEE